MTAFYAVIGRLCGDDEDTVLTFGAEDKEDAIRQFYEAALVIWGIDAEELARLSANGEGWFINNVLSSSAPIHEV